MISAMLADVSAAFPEAEFTDVGGDDVVRVDRADLQALAAAVHDAGYEMFADLCAVDHLTREPRFDIVVNLVSVAPVARLRILTGVPADDPAVPTLTGVYPGANFYEREAFDLFGIDFPGHPDLTRILLPDEWEGHPLRKDAPMGSVSVQFKESNKAL